MEFSVLTLFPELVQAFFDHGMISRAINQDLISGRTIQIRNFARDRHHTVDDRPYGGGSGMVMKPEPLAAAISQAKAESPNARVVLMTPQGEPFHQQTALDLARSETALVFVCGRYEGIDERVITRLVDKEISVGDYVMTGGELAAMVVMDAVSRLIPGVLGSSDSYASDSFMDDRLEYAQYTRPKNFMGDTVPEVLLSGDHAKISQWRTRSSLERTFIKRPDLFEKNSPSPQEKVILRQWCKHLEALIHG
ncbi:MAG TPA: tRNA (guanosine(37)-N1)-methyltransferase TrmD [Desulfotignum sp.]|nr:tRNA (guanosine(37)-N1)-methyltransferase TrmD [Desulfotignum sp.]